MRVLLSFFVGFTTLFVGCSTVSVNQSLSILAMLPAMEEISPGKDLESVDIYLRKRLAENPGEAMEWWTRYQQGKLWAQEDPIRSCGHFKALGAAPAFPLHNIAMLRAIEVCPEGDLTLPPLEQALATTDEPWLREILLRTVHARAAKTGETGLEMKLAGNIATHATLQTEKVQLLTRAIELAEQLQQSELKTEYKARLEKIAPRFREHPKPEEFLDVALDFRKARKFDEARSYYRKVIGNKKASDHDRYKALDGVRLTNKLEIRDERYVQATRDLADFARAKFKKNKNNRHWTGKFHDSQLQLARTLWTEKTVTEALKVVDQVERELSGHHSLDEVHWLRARIEEEAGRYENAVRILARAGGPGAANRAMTEKVHWYRAWNLRKLGRHKEAAEEFKALSTRLGSATNRPRNRFWGAKSLLALGQEEEAKKEFETLIADDPLGYYGLLAYRELGRELPSATPPERAPAAAPAIAADEGARGPAAQKPSPFASPHDHAYVEWLISLGELPIARRFLDHYAATRRRAANDSPEGREMLKYLARAGHFQTLFARLGGFEPAARARLLAEEPALLFPQPFLHFVSDAGRKFGVATELMYAIMRQESSFDPLARSHADAFGLMQLIPEAARRVEGSSGVKLETPEDLYRPDVNVTLGAAFLRNLMDQHNEQFVLTVASYNASEKAIRGWMKTRFKGDALEFIEDIPYEETRGYVKLVLRNYVFYLRLNSGGRPVAFPEWCLDSLHDFNS